MSVYGIFVETYAERRESIEKRARVASGEKSVCPPVLTCPHTNFIIHSDTPRGEARCSYILSKHRDGVLCARVLA